MSDDLFEKDDEAHEAHDEQRMPILWRDVPTVIAEQVVGHAVAGAMHRFVLAEVVFNPEPSATKPILRPNVNIAIPHMLLPIVIDSLQRAYDGVQAQVDEISAEGGNAE